MGLYTLLLSYLVIVGFASVIPAVFFADDDPSFADRSCEGGLEELRQDIEQKRLAFLSGERSDLAPFREELRQWDAKLTTLERKCGRSATDQLLQYRHRVELAVERYLREESRLARGVLSAPRQAAP